MFKAVYSCESSYVEPVVWLKNKTKTELLTDINMTQYDMFQK